MAKPRRLHKFEDGTELVLHRNLISGREELVLTSPDGVSQMTLTIRGNENSRVSGLALEVKGSAPVTYISEGLDEGPRTTDHMTATYVEAVMYYKTPEAEAYREWYLDNTGQVPYPLTPDDQQ